MKRKISSLFLFAVLVTLSTMTPQTSAQVTETFGNHFQKVISLNGDVKDFHKLQPGKVYNLPGGATDQLGPEDLNGIWGREKAKFDRTSISTSSPTPTDPTTSGPPMVEGGIQPTETSRLREYYQEYARNTGATLVGEILHGTISGEGMISYRNAPDQPHQILTPIPAYQATFLYPDGRLEVHQTLQACMNPAKRGGIGTVYSGFTFVPDPPSRFWEMLGTALLALLGIGYVVAVIYYTVFYKGKTTKAKEPPSVIFNGKTPAVSKDATPTSAKPTPSTDITSSKKRDFGLMPSPITSGEGGQKSPPLSTKRDDVEEKAPAVAKKTEGAKNAPDAKQSFAFTPADGNGPAMVRTTGGVKFTIEFDGDTTVTRIIRPKTNPNSPE